MPPMRHALLALALVLPAAAGPDPDLPDIFADFVIRESITGNRYYFTIQLDRPCAPAAVANFLGLATGARRWVDPATGAPSTEPFFDGSEIYRLEPGERVYFGSPGNDGTGGPGYIFQDQSLDTSSGTYQVYMENSGPNTNGSRFFISIPNAQLNKTHTRLGWVQLAAQAPPPDNNGFINVTKLSNLNRNEDGSPFYKLAIESLEIRGWDVEDPTFILDVWDLPVVAKSRLRILKINGRWRLKGTNLPGSVLSYFGAVDLQNWIPFTHVDLPGTLPLGADITADVLNSTRGFYRGSSVYYPTWPADGLKLTDTVFTFDYIDDTNPLDPKSVQLILEFNTTGFQGVWTRTVDGEDAGTGEFYGTYTLEEPYRGRLQFNPVNEPGQPPAISPYTFLLDFDHHFPEEYEEPFVIDRFRSFTTPPYEPESHEGRWFYRYYPD